MWESLTAEAYRFKISGNDASDINDPLAEKTALIIILAKHVRAMLVIAPRRGE
jgi:hypothetical protein